MEALCDIHIELACLALFAVAYFCLSTLLLAPYITRIFDPMANTGRYFELGRRNEFPLAPNRIRRAFYYLTAIGSDWAARQRFPGLDFRASAPRWLVPVCTLQVICIVTAVVVGIMSAFLATHCSIH